MEDHQEIPEPIEIPELAHFYKWLENPGTGRRIKNVGRNDACVCKSGRKLKRCCGEFPLAQYRKVMAGIAFTES